jgi:peptide/nickel transport system permease protein
MLKFTLTRLVSGVVLLVVVSTATFFLAHLAMPNPTLTLLGSSATPAQAAKLAHQLGLDRPLIVQYGQWASHALVGDFGTSWRNSLSVWSQIALKLPVTLSVVTYALLLSAVFGGIIGMASGLRPGSVLDRILGFASVVLFAMPGFWMSIVLVIWFAIDLKWFPAVGYIQPSQSVVGWIETITLPAVSLALGSIVMVAQQLRNSIIDVNAQDFVRTLRSRGLPPRRVQVHLLRNAAPPSLTVLAMMFVGLLGGAIVVEQVFSLPGIGALTNGASQAGDIPILLGVTVITIVFVVIVNFLLDLALGALNPKARVQ